MSKATEKELANLHKKVAAVLTESLSSTDEATYLVETYPELPQEVYDFLVKLTIPSAAVLQIATKFLKDNNISCDADTDHGINELKDSLAHKRRLSVCSARDLAVG